MNRDKLNSLRIEAQQKRRSNSPVIAIAALILVLTATTVYFAWPRESDNERVLAGTAATPTPTATNDESTKRSVAPMTKTPTDPAAKSSPGSSQPVTSLGRRNSSNGSSGDTVALTVSGYIINRERIEISPRFMGMVKWIGVKKGDSVTNNQVVVLLDDAEYRARLREIEGRLLNANVSVQKAQLDLKRAEGLVANEIETRKTLDDARLQLSAAEATVKEIEGAHELIQTYIDWCVIRSPVNGVILEKLVDPGELVTPQSFGGTRGPSTALIAVADPTDLQVEIDLNESDLYKVSLNQPCRVSPEAFPEKSYQGSVAEIAPEASRQKGTLQIKVQIKNPDRFLTPELSAKVDFFVSAKTTP